MAFHSKNRVESWLPALFDGEFQWDFLKPCWKQTKIEPMDFDAVVERKEKFLIFETKIPGKKIQKGQQITLTQAWHKGNTSILCLAGKKPEDITGYRPYWQWEVDTSIKIGDNDMIPGDAFDVIFNVRRWFCWASNLNIPDREEWDRELWLWDFDRNLEKKHS